MGAKKLNICSKLYLINIQEKENEFNRYLSNKILLLFSSCTPPSHKKSTPKPAMHPESLNRKFFYISKDLNLSNRKVQLVLGNFIFK